MRSRSGPVVPIIPPVAVVRNVAIAPLARVESLVLNLPVFSQKPVGSVVLKVRSFLEMADLIAVTRMWALPVETDIRPYDQENRYVRHLMVAVALSHAPTEVAED
jgi:hypothetical protein